MAETRETQVIEDVIDGTEINNPRTTEEAILAQVVAGEEVTINARTSYQNWLRQLRSGSSNPNTIETITGTVDNPFGNLTKEQLMTLRNDINANQATIYIEVDASLISFGKFILTCGPRTDDTFTFWFNGISAATENLSDWNCVVLSYYNWNNLDNIFSFHARAIINGSVRDMSAYGAYITTVLTIIHHPLPEDNSDD